MSVDTILWLFLFAVLGWELLLYVVREIGKAWRNDDD